MDVVWNNTQYQELFSNCLQYEDVQALQFFVIDHPSFCLQWKHADFIVTVSPQQNISELMACLWSRLFLSALTFLQETFRVTTMIGTEYSSECVSVCSVYDDEILSEIFIKEWYHVYFSFR
jgi:hypothetical protein